MSNIIEIIKLNPESKYEIIQSKTKKPLFENDNNIYRCKPLNVASTYGWDVLCPITFSATWNGGNKVEDIVISCDDPDICYDCIPVSSHFGFGTLTFNMDFIVRTNENISLYVRSPVNTHFEGVAPLDAIVETDWLPYTYTYNLKFIKPGTVFFKSGEPLYTFFPVERGFIESFDTKISSIVDYPDLELEFEHYNQIRSLSNRFPKERHTDDIVGFYSRGENSMRKKYDISNSSKTTILKSFNYE